MAHLTSNNILREPCDDVTTSVCSTSQVRDQTSSLLYHTLMTNFFPIPSKPSRFTLLLYFDHLSLSLIVIHKGIWTKHLQYYLDTASSEARVNKYKKFLGEQKAAILHSATNSTGDIGSTWYAPAADAVSAYMSTMWGESYLIFVISREGPYGHQ